MLSRYFTSALPVLLLSFFPFFVLGLVASARNRQLALIALGLHLLWGAGALSLVEHKEFRFVFPLLPSAIIIAVYGMDEVFRAEGSRHVSDASIEHSSGLSRLRRLLSFDCVKRGALIVCLGLQIVAALYFSLIHQRGRVQVRLWCYGARFIVWTDKSGFERQFRLRL